MASPTKPVQTYDFSDYQVTHPRDPLPGDELDNQVQVLIQSANETIDALALIQRTDGRLANQSVFAETLAPDLYTQIIADVTPDLDDDVARAEGAAQAAQASALEATSQASAASAYASQANAAATTANTAASSAAASGTSAQIAAGNAQNDAVSAANSANAAERDANAASLSETKAYQWADYLAGPVPGTPYYSAHWWALQAYQIVTNFTDFGVASFNGRTGIVMPQSGDYLMDMLADVDLTGIAEGDTLVYSNGTFIPGQTSGGSPGSAGVASFNGRTGNVVPGDNDYSLNMLNDVSTAGAVDDYVLTFVNGGWVPKALPASGNVSGPASAIANRFAAFSDTTGKVIRDSGYSPSSFAAATHTHPTSQITGLDAALANKAALVHTHEITDVNGLQQTLASKASSTTKSIATIDTNAPTLTPGALHVVNGASAGAAVTYQINTSSLGVGTFYDFVLNNAASITFSAGANVTILSEDSKTALSAKGAGASLTLLSRNGLAEVWSLVGRLA